MISTYILEHSPEKTQKPLNLALLVVLLVVSVLGYEIKDLTGFLFLQACQKEKVPEDFKELQFTPVCQNH